MIAWKRASGGGLVNPGAREAGMAERVPWWAALPAPSIFTPVHAKLNRN